ncbi:PRD domain-containing protein, partial [Enterococcus cecorum]|uniref:BglG family transcription antiterminator n=1 Tax=Enterococcus cecorum TaxID=44008 RepID=UPI001FAB8633
YLYSSRLITNNVLSDQESSVMKIAQNISSLVIEHFDIKVEIQDLATEIYPHLKMMLYRIKQRINISNELLIDIKREYRELFDFLKNEVVESISDGTVSDDEIGFLTLYFAKYMEQIPEKIKILVICSSGVGTSELLKVKIKQSIPEVEIVEALSVNQFTKSISLDRFKDIDLIVSTIKMNETYGIPCILVNAIFTESDKKALRKRLEELQC